jgi:hypothetical protein
MNIDVYSKMNIHPVSKMIPQKTLIYPKGDYFAKNTTAKTPRSIENPVQSHSDYSERL